MTESEELLRLPEDASSFEADLAALVHRWLAILRGAFDQAQERLDAAVTLGQTLSDMANLSVAFAGLEEVALADGQVEVVIRHYRQGLILGWNGEFPAGVVFNL